MARFFCRSVSRKVTKSGNEEVTFIREVDALRACSRIAHTCAIAPDGVGASGHWQEPSASVYSGRQVFVRHVKFYSKKT